MREAIRCEGYKCERLADPIARTGYCKKCFAEVKKIAKEETERTEKKEVKWIQDQPMVCKTCEHSDRGYKIKENESLDKDIWYCEFNESRRKKVDPNKPACERFMLDYEMDVKTMDFFGKAQ